jgi:hypothetical protein
MVVLGTVALIVIRALERWILHWHASQRVTTTDRSEKRPSTRSVV